MTSTVLLREPSRLTVRDVRALVADSPAAAATTADRIVPAALGLAACCGAAAVELAYAAGSGSAWAGPAFWAGQVLLYAAVAAGVIRKRTGDTARLWLLLLLGIATFLVKVGYSPLYFAFPDELQHLRSLHDLAVTHHLFHPNPSLPVSPSFPGLEIATDAVTSTTGLTPFGAGLAISGFAHVLLTVAVFVLFRAVLGAPRAAALATVLFATEPHFEYFDAIFAYQTIALPFFALALVALVKLGEPGRSRRWSWTAYGAACVAALIVSHHLTSYAFLVLGAVAAATAYRRGVRAPALFTAGATLATAAWTAGPARRTISYLWEPISESLLSALPGHTATAQTHGAAAAAPLADRIPAYVSVLCVLALIGAGWAMLVRGRARPRTTALIAFAVCALSYPAVLAVRLSAADASELTGRALTYCYVPTVALAAAFLLRSRRRGGARTATLAVVVVLVLAVGGIATGWPPWWERLPGPFRVASFESGIDSFNRSAAFWAGGRLPPDHHIAGGLMDGSLFASYGRQISVLDVGSLFYAPTFGPVQIAELRAQSIRYVIVDRRMAAQLPAVGGYFGLTPAGVDPRRPLTARSLAKFDTTSHLDRIYDNGEIRVYAVR